MGFFDAEIYDERQRRGGKHRQRTITARQLSLQGLVLGRAGGVTNSRQNRTKSKNVKGKKDETKKKHKQST